MKVIEIRALRGPNVFHEKPILTMRLDLEDLAETASDAIPGFIDRLVTALPGLHEHRCSPGRPGGFVERLHRGTYFAHIVEHIALELSTSCGIEVGYGKTRHDGAEGIYKVAIRYRDEEAMTEILRLSVAFAEALARGRDYDLTTAIERIKERIEETALGPTGRTLADAADARGIPWRKIGDGSLLQLGYGKQRRRVQTAVSDFTSLIAADLVQDKQLTKKS